MPKTKLEANLAAKEEAKLQGQSEDLEKHQKLTTYKFRLFKSDILRLQKLADKEQSTLGYQIERCLDELFEDCQGLELPEPKPKECWYARTREVPLIKSRVNGGVGSVKVVSHINRKYLPLPETLGEVRMDSKINEMDLEGVIVSLQPRYLRTLSNLADSFQLTPTDALYQALSRYLYKHAVEQPNTNARLIQAQEDRYAEANRYKQDLKFKRQMIHPTEKDNG